jgi:hypothetical protein
MNTGGSFGFERVLQFNGSFFENGYNRSNATKN